MITVDKKIRGAVLCCAAAAVCWGSPAYAQSQDDGLLLIVNQDFGRDSNVTQTEVSGDRLSSNYGHTRLNLSYAGERQQSFEYVLKYLLDHRDYEVDKLYNRTDQHLIFDSVLRFNQKNRLNLGASYNQEEQDLDSVNRFDAAEERGNEYDFWKLQGHYSYGAEGAKANLTVGVEYEERRYENNLFTGSRNINKDRDVTTLGGSFSYRLSPDFKLLFDARYYDLNYVESTSSLKGDALRAFGGFRWFYSPKLRFTARLGSYQRNFDQGSGRDIDNLFWEVEGKWAPVRRTVFTFQTSRVGVEGSDREDLIDIKSARIAWQQRWLDRLDTEWVYIRSESNYEGSVNDGADADLDNVRFSLNYQWRSDLSFHADYTQLEQISNFEETFDRDTLKFGLRYVWGS